MSLRARSVGEILSDAIALMRQHFLSLVRLALPFAVFDLLSREGAKIFLGRVRRVLGEGDLGRLGEALPDIAACVALTGAWVLALQALGCAVVAFCAPALDGETPSAERALRDTVRGLGRIALTTALFAVGITGVGLVLPLAATAGIAWFWPNPYFLLVFFALTAPALTLIVFLRWVLWSQTLVVEGARGFRPLSRSAELMRGRGGPFSTSPKVRLSLLLLVFFAVASSLQSMFALPQLVVGFARGLVDINDFDPIPPLTALPAFAALPLAVLTVAANSLVLPLQGLLTTLFYADLLVRFEGRERLHVDDGTSPATTSPAPAVADPRDSSAAAPATAAPVGVDRGGPG